MTHVLHNYSSMANKTVFWDTSDSQEAYDRNKADPTARQRLHDLGYLEVPIEYRFNSHGFRTKEFDQKIDLACFGCSFTMGTGVHSHQTWPEQLEKLSGMSVANLGQAGSSNDTAFRLALHYLSLLQPRVAIWLQTDIHRIEIIDQDLNVNINVLASDNKNPCAKDYFTKLWFSYPINQELNLKKNTFAFQYFCTSLGIKPVVLPRSAIVTHPWPHGAARDLIHPGAPTYKLVAESLIQSL